MLSIQKEAVCHVQLQCKTCTINEKSFSRSWKGGNMTRSQFIRFYGENVGQTVRMQQRAVQYLDLTITISHIHLGLGAKTRFQIIIEPYPK